MDTATFDPGALRLGCDLRRQGVEPLRGAWHRVRRGVFVPEPAWAGMTPDQRYAALVYGCALVSDGPAMIFARASAAALLGLPRVSAWPAAATILVPPVSGPSRLESTARADGDTVPANQPAGNGTRARGGGAFIRRVHGCCERPVVVHGVSVTPVARTIIDLARHDRLENAVAAADYALRARLCTRDDLADEARDVAAGAPGRKAAAMLPYLAEPGSMSVGESLSRVQMFRLNLPRPLLQREFRDERGLIGYADFAWPGLVGEFDGRQKYGVEFARGPGEMQEILWQEKQREDRLRRQVDVARWTWSTALNHLELGRLLGAHGLRPEARTTWLR